MAGIKIVDLPALGRDLISTDLLEVSLNGSGSRKITGQEIMNASKLAVGSTPIVSGTVGRLLFQNTGDVLGQSANLFWDNTNGRLGIGTTSPSTGTLLDVIGTIKANVLRSDVLNNTSNTITLIYFTGTGNRLYDNSGTQVLNLRGGNLQIGTTTDNGYKLNVNGPGNYEGNLRVGVGFQLLFNNNNVGLYREANTLKLGGFGGIELTASATQITAQSIRMKIFDTGNVAINTTTDDGFRLDVNGTARVQGLTTLAGTMTALGAIARNGLINGTLVAAANNDVLVGLDIAPTFTNGAFTGLTNVDLRTSGANVTIGSSYGYGALYGYNNDGLVQIKTAATYKTQMWFRPSGNAGGYNGNYWSRIEHDMGTLNIIGSSYGQLSIASANGSGSGARIYFSGATGVANNALSLEGPVNSGRIALITYASSPITINGGNLLVGTTTDAGYKLDVNGTARVSSSFRCDGQVTFTSAVIGTTIRLGSNPQAASSILDVQSTTKGFLPPRMTNAQRAAIASPAVGLIVYCTDSTEGLYVYKSTGWTFMV